MDSLNGITIFVRVAETRSFTETGRVLGVSSSAVGKSIARMEERLGVRLFHRSTRSIALTSEGTLFLERCRRILSEVEAAEVELSQLSGNPRGKLRVSLPQLTSLMMPVMTGFMQRYPEIELDLHLSDSMVDVIEDGYDVVVRTGSQQDSRLLSRRLGACGFVLVGTPGYFMRRGTPLKPDDLAGHACVVHRFPATGKLEPWILRREPDVVVPVLTESAVCSNIEAVLYVALQGLGIAWLPLFIVQDALDKGALQTVLDDFAQETVTFSMLWPASRQTSPRLRAFIDYMGSNLMMQARE